nr:SOS response-associated peptidase [Flavobacterium sp.]
MEDIETRYGVKYYQPQYYDNKPPMPSKFIHGFEHPGMLIITNKRPDLVTVAEWGLVPHWAKDPEAFREKANTLNAMIETIDDKPSFRDAVNNRCLVVVDSFYEYKWLDPKGKEKEPYKIQLEGGMMFSLAGIFSRFTDPTTGQPVGSVSLVTTKANPLMEIIHNSKKRMPLVLRHEEEQSWLSGDPMKKFENRNEISLLAEPTQNYLRTLKQAS